MKHKIQRALLWLAEQTAGGFLFYLCWWTADIVVGRERTLPTPALMFLWVPILLAVAGAWIGTRDAGKFLDTKVS